MTDEVKRIWEEYMSQCHAVQAGVAMEMHHNPAPTDPKHLRTGVNIAMCDSAALAGLLIAKGVITDEEYATACRDKMRAEVEAYEQRLSDRLGTKITLV